MIDENNVLTVRECSHYRQAYSLIYLHVVHAPDGPGQDPQSPFVNGTNPNKGFSIYSPLPPSATSSSPDSAQSQIHYAALVSLMRSLRDNHWEIEYFKACRALGVYAVDAIVQGRVCELRWTPTLAKEDLFGSSEAKKNVQMPVLVPMTPVLRAAMSDILNELEDNESP